ncbi:response regulator [Zavarzinella formosa]|uniref:response regulator n=1 Tax=Zavarzinella formosa TaxID=360055 RepID=UPI00138B077D|nr:response regulator [Zavarzinella formosa]
MSKSRAIEVLREAIAAAKGGDRPRARLLLIQATETDPRNDLAWMWRASLCEDPAESLRHLETVLALNPANNLAMQAMKSARLNAGVAAAQAGDRETARRLLRQSCEADPGNDIAWMWLAGVTESPAEALSHVEKALRINPNSEQAKTGAEYYREKLKAAPPLWYCPICLAKSETRFIVCPNCHSVLSLANAGEAITNFKSDEKKLREGMDRLENNLRTKPDFTTYYYLGMAMLNLQRMAEGINYFREAKKLNPDNEAFAQHLAVLEQRSATPKEPRRTDPGTLNGLAPTPIPAVAVPPAPEPEAKPRKCVLVVDDSPTIRKLIALTLNRHGYRAIEAGDGSEAVDRIQAGGNPDMVVLDATLPDMDGHALCKLIRKNKELSKIPIVMLSGKDGFFDKIRGKMGGATICLTKPFQPEALVRIVQKYCPVETESPATTD